MTSILGTPQGEAAFGVTASVSFTPAAAAYGAGDIQDVAKKITFVDNKGVGVPANSLVRVLTTILKIDVTAVPGGQTSYALQCYSVTPPSARVDNDPWTLAEADLDAYLGAIALGTPVDLGACLYVASQNVDIDLKLSGSSIYGELVTAGAHTSAAVARQITLFGVRQ